MLHLGKSNITNFFQKEKKNLTNFWKNKQNN